MARVWYLNSTRANAEGPLEGRGCSGELAGECSEKTEIGKKIIADGLGPCTIKLGRKYFSLCPQSIRNCRRTGPCTVRLGYKYSFCYVHIQ